MNNGGGGGGGAAPGAGALVNLDPSVLLAEADTKRRDFKATAGLRSRTARPVKTALPPLRPFILAERAKTLELLEPGM